MSALTQYLDKISARHRELVERLDALIHEAEPGLQCGLKWGNLTYGHQHNVCAFISHGDHINLQLWCGAELKDPGQRLKGSGKKMRHIKITTIEDIEENYFRELLRQASSINR